MVIERSIMNLYESVPFAAEDLPDYAVRLFDFITEATGIVRRIYGNAGQALQRC